MTFAFWPLNESKIGFDMTFKLLIVKNNKLTLYSVIVMIEWRYNYFLLSCMRKA